MKKNITLLMLLSLIVGCFTSCKTEEILSANNASEVIAKNSIYDFAEKQYYYQGKLITDSSQIKTLLDNAVALDIDENNKATIYDNEAKYNAAVESNKLARVAAKDPNPQHKNLMIFHYGLIWQRLNANLMPTGDIFFTSYHLQGPRPVYPKTFATGDLFNLTKKVPVGSGIHNLILADLVAMSYKTIKASLKLTVHNPSLHPKKLILMLNTKKTISVIIAKQSTWSVVSDGRKTGGVNGYLVGHNVITF